MSRYKATEHHVEVCLFLPSIQSVTLFLRLHRARRPQRSHAQNLRESKYSNQRDHKTICHSEKATPPVHKHMEKVFWLAATSSKGLRGRDHNIAEKERFRRSNQIQGFDTNFIYIYVFIR